MNSGLFAFAQEHCASHGFDYFQSFICRQQGLRWRVGINR